MRRNNRKLTWLAASALALCTLFVLPGCEDEPDTLGEHLEKAGEEIGDAVDDATDELKDAAKEVKEEFDNDAG